MDYCEKRPEKGSLDIEQLNTRTLDEVDVEFALEAWSYA